MSSVLEPVGAPPALARILSIAEGSDPPTRSWPPVRSAQTPELLTPDVLAPDVQGWFASPEQGLVARIESVNGAAATTETLARLAPARLTVSAAVVTDDACWAEVIRGGGDQMETCVLGLSYDDASAVSRLVWLRAPLAPPASTGEAAPSPQDGNGETTAADGRPILERYLTDLSRSRFAEAAAHFTLDTVYSHPPYGGGTVRVLYRSREALANGFAYDRGPSPVRQVITGVWQRGGRMFVEGVIEGIPNGGTFFSTAQISPEGEIARYVAFYSATRIPRLRTIPN